MRRAMGLLEQSRDLIEMGAYTPGSSPRLDAALRAQSEIAQFLRQDANSPAPRAESLARMAQLSTSLGEFE
jgi:flagellum-specific ATP synthase